MMTFELAVRLTEILLGLAFIQQSAEHVFGLKRDRLLFGIRLVLSVLLVAGVFAPWLCLALLAHAFFVLQRFQGPFNGGSDRMSLLILVCLCWAHLAPTLEWREVGFGYLALQLILSYFIAGWVKLVNPAWRCGRALRDVFAFSAYPANESLRGWSDRPRALWLVSWAVILFELLFPLAMVSAMALYAALAIAAIFHLSNAYFLGLNRFVWFWIAAYPSLIWLQERLFGNGY